MTKELIATRKRILVCLSYSDKDFKEKDRLLSHLDILRQAGMVEVWSIDQKISEPYGAALTTRLTKHWQILPER